MHIVLQLQTTGNEINTFYDHDGEVIACILIVEDP